MREKEKERDRDEFYKIFKSKGKHHFEQLYIINKKKFIKGYGSYLFNGKRYSYDKSMYKKQKLLFYAFMKTSADGIANWSVICVWCFQK